MRGTFENPPIIIEQDRVKLGLSLAIAVVGALFSAWRLWTGAGKNEHLMFFLVFLFGALSLYLIYALFHPGRLTLEPGGLTWYTGIRSFRYSWSDFSSFVIYKPRIFCGSRATSAPTAPRETKSFRVSWAERIRSAPAGKNPPRRLSIVSTKREHAGDVQIRSAQRIGRHRRNIVYSDCTLCEDTAPPCGAITTVLMFTNSWMP